MEARVHPRRHRYCRGRAPGVMSSSAQADCSPKQWVPSKALAARWERRPSQWALRTFGQDQSAARVLQWLARWARRMARRDKRAA
eukprot:scaffold123219_cov57-Phaeocystis_antarctica.AAC.2